MIIRNLSSVSISVLMQTFNEAFSDYLVPLQVTEAQLAQKIHADQIRLDLSVGAFKDDQLIGFILHGIEKPMAWNGGTGVIPAQRGQGITNQLYEFVIPLLRQTGIQKTQLEVLVENHPAVRIYQKNGFTIQRSLDCFSGEIQPKELKVKAQIKAIPASGVEIPAAWKNWEPSFQHRNSKVKNLGDHILHLAAYQDGKVVGYLQADKAVDKPVVYQFAVAETHRKQGIGRALFQHLAKTKIVPLRVTNVDNRDQASLDFLKGLGLDCPFQQYEMIRLL